MNLRRAIALAFALTFYGMSCRGQTNVCGPSLPFFLPPLQLRTEPRSKPAPPETVSVLAIPSASIENFVIGDGLGDNALHSRVLRSGEFYLTRAATPPDSGVVRFVDSLFRPEIIQIGKASVACPIVTALKRKNPLCLLSGLAMGQTLTGEGQISYKILQIWW